MKQLIWYIFLCSTLCVYSVSLAGAQNVACSTAKSEERCLTDKDCDVAGCNLYCAFPEGSCGENSVRGECRERAELCPMVYSPVCGCDAKSYSNACAAAAAGVSVRVKGDCAKGSS